MWNGFFVKKLKILYSSDQPILIKFRQFVVSIVIKELQMVLWLLQLSTAMEALNTLNAKLSVKSWLFDRVFHIAVANADIGSLKCHL